MTIKTRIKINDIKQLSDNYFSLLRYDFSYHRNDGTWQDQMREVYDCGDGAAILLYNLKQRTIILIKQLRLPAFLNGHDDLMLEVPAGLLDAAHPETRIIAEVEEETGYRIRHVKKIMEAFVSPGAVKQKLHLFIGEYSASDKVSQGGGHHHEGEDIEVLEVMFDDAVSMIKTGQLVDAKAIMLIQYAQLNLFKAD